MAKSYDDILRRARPVSRRRSHIDEADRAAQFSPFAALTGLEERVEEAGRLTGERIELAEDAQAELDAKLALLRECLAERPLIRVTYFVPDERKSGGTYTTVLGRVKKLDETEKYLSLEDGRKIDFGVECSLNLEIFLITCGGVIIKLKEMAEL